MAMPPVARLALVPKSETTGRKPFQSFALQPTVRLMRQVIKKQLKVMDLSAFNTCRDAGIPIYVYNFFEHDLRDVLSGRKIGTIISGG